jgi:hypothetical protein
MAAGPTSKLTCGAGGVRRAYDEDGLRELEAERVREGVDAVRGMAQGGSNVVNGKFEGVDVGVVVWSVL